MIVATKEAKRTGGPSDEVDVLGGVGTKEGLVSGPISAFILDGSLW